MNFDKNSPASTRVPRCTTYFNKTAEYGYHTRLRRHGTCARRGLSMEMPRVGRRAAPGPTPQEMPFDRSNCIGFSRAGQVSLVSPTPNPSKSCQNAPKLSPLQPPQRVPKRQRRTPPPRGPPTPVTYERERAVGRPGGRPGASCSDATAGPGYRRFWAPPQAPPRPRGRRERAT